ncbi:LOW QUALITY PROTEIN: uncharacterized protein LOC133530798 [Cydia pomonella]|uniref:LOW QUALITY PROTEIN: uncharacterized protein LOC133530798 n=1 Tax=Cydia pomonella TaxID=82600 RepID=UPI002ADE7B02|nr:LOW QUALITY PROTEIN: uncharacterized protein LOC133530798 [Cydia pomonella]
MDSEGSSSGLPGSDNQDSNEPTPPGTVISFKSTPPTLPRKLLPSSKGVENAKKRLRAFSIQKKTPITAVPLAKPASSPAGTGSTVLIGKLSSVKPVPPKVVEDESKKLAKPPKPGANRKNFQDSYTELQKRTLAEIEDMKRKMELVDLGIPLGLICPSSTNEQAMPTKAMPPIKTFLDASKVDEIIRDAKKARAEGKEFKFDYQKILPDYDNPFQRKIRDEGEKEKEDAAEKEQIHKSPRPPKLNRISVSRSRDSKRKSDRYESSRRHSDRYDRSRKSDRDRYREKHDKSREKDSKRETKDSTKSGGSESVVDQDPKETDVNLSDYLVCDSWSLDNDDKTASPQVDDKSKATPTKEKKSEESRTAKDLDKKKEEERRMEKEAILKAVDSPCLIKIEKLQPVIDSFEYEIDPNEDDILFDEHSKPEYFAKVKPKKSFDYNQDTNMSDSLADDNFLESVINEIKQENISDDESQDKGLVEYDSPIVDFKCQGTPELDDDSRQRLSRTSDYSDSYRSTDSGCKSTESGYRSTESGYTSKSEREKSSEKKSKGRKDSKNTAEEKVFLSVEKVHDETLERKVSRSTIVSLEMWDFVLKICQPLLFRHDKTKCYKQTRVQPSVWWAARPTACSCVRGRGVVLSELRAQRMALVDRVYSTDQTRVQPSVWWAARPTACSCVRGRGVVLSELRAQRMALVDRVYSTDHVWWAARPTACSCVRGRGVVLSELRAQRMALVDRVYSTDHVWWAARPTACSCVRGRGVVLSELRAQRMALVDRVYSTDQQTRVQPSVWWAARPTACSCVRGRGVVLSELRAQRMALVDRVYSTDQISDGPFSTKRSWYPPLEQCLAENITILSREEALPPIEGALPQKEGALPQNETSVEGISLCIKGVEGVRPRAEGSEVKTRVEGAEGRQRRPKGADTPQHGDTQLLDREYQRFMEALEVAEAQVQSRSTTPVRAEDTEGKRAEEKEKVKLSSEGWSQESEVDEEVGNTSMVKKSRKQKGEEKEKARKRKRSPSTLSSASDDEEVKRKKAKKKTSKKSKTKLAKRRRTEKKYMKKLREKQKKKKAKAVKISEDEEESPKKKLKDKKIKKKQKLKKIQKKKKKAKVSSSSSSSSSSSDSDTRKKKKKNKKKKEDSFDVNILNNIKTEKLTDDEKCQKMIEDFSPRRQQEKRPEIINVKELGVQIKQEVEEEETREETEAMDDFDLGNNDEFMDASNVEQNEFKNNFQEPQDRLTPQRPEENSQCSSQDSACSEKPPSYEKDESHLRPSSQNSNYSFNDVIASQTGLYNKGIEADDNEYEPENYEMYEQLAMAYQSDVASNEYFNLNHSFKYVKMRQPRPLQNSNYSFNDVIACQSGPYKGIEADDNEYEPENYEMYEQLAMAYQSDVASNQVPLPSEEGTQRIETVVRRRLGEIKCDWRAGAAPPPGAGAAARPSRWGECAARSRDRGAASARRDQVRLARRRRAAAGGRRRRQAQPLGSSATGAPAPRRRRGPAPPPGPAAGVSVQRGVETVVRRRLGEIKCDWRAGAAPPPGAGAAARPSRWGECAARSRDRGAASARRDQRPWCGVGSARSSATGAPAPRRRRGPAPPPGPAAGVSVQRGVETVVRRRLGEIKCDWRAGAAPPPGAGAAARPSRWGLKPGEVNIVLTGGSDCTPERVYRIHTITSRSDNSSGSYDEAYMDTYGAMDRLQYGDCFSAADAQSQSQEKDRRGTLDDRIDQALRHTVLGEIAMEPENKDSDADKDNREKGILITSGGGRGVKRVSFADGYTPGQDSDTEQPPAKKRARRARVGCAWPCPASHADHVPLWDALPPPPPPPGSPPPPARAAPPLHLLRARRPPAAPRAPPHPQHKFDPSVPMPAFMPPEPPPGLISFQ